MLSGDDRDAPLPEDLRSRELVQRSARAREQVRPDDGRRGGVDEVPVVDAIGASKIRAVNPQPCGRVAARVLVRQQDDREEPRLVPGRRQENLDLRERQRGELTSQFPYLRHVEAEKTVTGPVFSGTGPEETLRARGPTRIREPTHATQDERRTLTHHGRRTLTYDGRRTLAPCRRLHQNVVSSPTSNSPSLFTRAPRATARLS